MTIYALETPHRGEPRCWTAKDREDFVVRIIRTDWSGDFDIDSPFDDAVAWAARDLEHLDIYESTDDAARAVVEWNVGGHRPDRARHALLKWVALYAWEIEDRGVLREFVAACEPLCIDLSEYLTQGVSA